MSRYRGQGRESSVDDGPDIFISHCAAAVSDTSCQDDDTPRIGPRRLRSWSKT